MRKNIVPLFLDVRYLSSAKHPLTPAEYIIMIISNTKKGGNKMNDAEVKQSILAVREEFGDMLRNIMWPLRECLGLSLITHEDEAERRGKAIALFYKQLIAADIDKTAALQIVQKLFIDPVDVANIFREYMLKNQETARELAINIINSHAAKS
jgi:hypothetical protein